eukprot:GHVN01025585.1.p1 GENE.GHVN01025585.1~~GHVN01025585.1.p1  ORF type:complete len:115 (-),score=59.97 GHVN01025585.1:93-437(-)
MNLNEVGEASEVGEVTHSRNKASEVSEVGGGEDTSVIDTLIDEALTSAYHRCLAVPCAPSTSAATNLLRVHSSHLTHLSTPPTSLASRSSVVWMDEARVISVCEAKRARFTFAE